MIKIFDHIQKYLYECIAILLTMVFDLISIIYGLYLYDTVI